MTRRELLNTLRDRIEQDAFGFHNLSQPVTQADLELVLDVTEEVINGVLGRTAAEPAGDPTAGVLSRISPERSGSRRLSK